jgi:mevalonate kinase
LVEISENYAHGKASGIDMTAVASDNGIFNQKSKGASPILASKPFSIVVADSGEIGHTKKAVDHVRKLRQVNQRATEAIIDEIGDIVWKAKEVILTGNSLLLGRLLLDNHEYLKKMEVSNPILDHLVEVAMRAGALGAKLTGGGMGGCIIALSKDMLDARKIGKELIKEGAKKVWYFSTDSKDLRRMEGS